LPQIGSLVEPLHRGLVPFGAPMTALHCPLSASHASHWPLQADSQQTPSTQNPDVQSVAAVQVTPSGLPMQTPPVHFRPVAQSVSPAQLVLHAAVAESQMYGAQGVVVFGVQAPVVVHSEALAADAVPTHAAGAQVVPVVVTRQAPVPLQTPFDEHVPLPIVPHSLSGSVASLMFSQRPSTENPFFAALQALQVPLHAELQQTPS
jgi:hypothetical protein